MKRSVSRASKVSTDGQDSFENGLGNMSDGKWQEFLEKEETDLFILGLREEIVQRCIDICFESYLQKQAVAFTVYCASVACCKVLNIYYMFRDPGDIDDPIVRQSWEPDCEPEPSVIDSWGSYSLESLVFDTPATSDAKKPKNYSVQPSHPASMVSEVESSSFASDLFGFGEEDDFPMLYSFSPSWGVSDRNKRKSLFTRTLSSSLDSLSLSCLKIFKMGNEAQKKPSDTHPTCGSKSSDSFY